MIVIMSAINFVWALYNLINHLKLMVDESGYVESYKPSLMDIIIIIGNVLIMIITGGLLVLKLGLWE